MEEDATVTPMEGPQNLNDLQNYLVTFNKEIGVTGDNTFQQNISQYVVAQQNSEVVLSGGINESLIISEVKHSQKMDGGKDVEELTIEPMETDEQLNAVHAHIAGLTSGQIQAVSISGHIPLESLHGLQTSGSEGVMMIPINGDSMVGHGGQQLFQIVPLDGGGQATLQLTKEQDDGGGNQCDVASIDAVQVSDSHMIDGTDPVAVLASVAANTSNVSQLQISQQDLNSAQLVALQNSSDSSQPQLVAVQGMDGTLTEGGLQMVSGIEGLIPNSLVLNTGGGGGITLLPSGDMNQQYVLLVNHHQNGDKGGPMYDFGADIKGEIVEEITDEDGTTKRIVKINQLLAKKSLENMAGIPYGDQLMCTYCEYTSPKRYLLSRHMKTHSEDRPHKCNLCQRGFKTMASLQNHVNTHSGIRPHKCKMCESAFTTSGELVRHIRYKHTFEKPHKCTVCDYASVELSKLKRHIRSHTGERPYQCMHCTYASPDTYKLKRHLRIHTGEKPYECNICHARFTQSNSLKAHKLIHTGNKPVFQCELCPATCGRKTDLKIHMQKLHSSEKPLTCKKCGETCLDRYTFKMHIKSHDGEKCYKCPDCDYAALSLRHLETHGLTHTGEKPFECTDCDQSFRQKQLLKRHKNLYHTPDYTPPYPKDKEHECSECEKAYAHKGNLLRHMQQHDDGSPVKIICTHQKSRVVPLTADQLIHNSLLADMKEGKLGTSPKVVVVHPDGRVEEVTAKLQSMSQSKPVDDFLVSLGVTADSNYGVDESGDGTTEATNVVLTMNNESVPVSATFQTVIEAQEAQTTAGFANDKDTVVEATEEDDDQRKEAGTQAAFDSDSEEEHKKKAMTAGAQSKSETAAVVELRPVLPSGQSGPADMEDVQHIMISVLQAEAANNRKEPLAEVQAATPTK